MMIRPKHLYRKGFQHQVEADGTANGFAAVGNIDKPGPTNAWVEEENGTFYVYVELEGKMDPDEVLAATGYERVA
jgi:hypothetical protein